MPEKITAYIIGRIKLGSSLADKEPDIQAEELLDTFKEISEVDIITGEWDMLVKFEVPSMEEYYHVAWGIAKYLERGWGALVAKKVTRDTDIRLG
jgi:DNA-binding Lrp family transcriptional regulator